MTFQGSEISRQFLRKSPGVQSLEAWRAPSDGNGSTNGDVNQMVSVTWPGTLPGVSLEGPNRLRYLLDLHCEQICEQQQETCTATPKVLILTSIIRTPTRFIY